jgi:site-specific DNA recombinase
VITPWAGASGSNHDQRDATDAEASAEIAAVVPVLRIQWSPIHSKRRREIILPEQADIHDHRPIRAETRATLVRAIALGRRWLDELVTGSIAGPDAIAAREGCSRRHVERTISLAFLAPDLVQAAVEGRLPRGVGVSCLIDMPSEWRRQWQMLGLPQ